MLTEHKDGAVTLSNERLMVCLECVWELDALAMLLPDIVPVNPDGHNEKHFAVRGVAGRIKQLAGVLVAGLGDSMEETGQLHDLVRVSA